MTHDNNRTDHPQSQRRAWIFDLLLVAVLLVGAYFRFVGVNWDEFQHLHPDERFLTMVESGLQPVKSLAEYFDTGSSTLNPPNVGFGFYVYGDLPIIIVRYLAEWLGQTGYDRVFLLGRQLSALYDLFAVLLIYLAASRLYDRRVGILAAAFSAFAVLQIQLAHYFTVDSATLFFGMCALYLAVRVQTAPPPAGDPAADGLADGSDAATTLPMARAGVTPRLLANLRSMLAYAFFGLALGAAAASKIDAAPMALLLPIAAWVRYRRLSPDEQARERLAIWRNLVVGGIVFLVAFRVFMPYAFSGPGFFGVLPDSRWLSSLRELQGMSNGSVDFPPALQWARRPVTFVGKNLVLWGLGLPLGILAWLGILWMGWRILKGERAHLGLVAWTLFVFVWRSLAFSANMRYLILIYPTLEIAAAWALVSLWQWGKARAAAGRPARWAQVAALVAGVLVLGATLAWGFAFSRIYTRPVTRVAATRWIYQNVPGPLNLKITDAGGEVTNQPLTYPYGATLDPNSSYELAFRPAVDGKLASLSLPHVVDRMNDGGAKTLAVRILPVDSSQGALAEANTTGTFLATGDPDGPALDLTFDPAPELKAGQTYHLQVELTGGDGLIGLSGAPLITLETARGPYSQALLYPTRGISAENPYIAGFTAAQSGTLGQVVIGHLVDREAAPGEKSVRLTVKAGPEGEAASATLRGSFAAGSDPRGDAYTFTLEPPIQLNQGEGYSLQLDLAAGEGTLALYGASPANESTWDDGLPLRMDGYDGYGGIYQPDLNFQMYWDDNADKLQRFETTLDQADYLFISSNRQWGTTPRVPERYPLTTEYYRALLGCPPEDDILWCYSVAKPGTFQGQLGFELVQVFQSNPNLGPLQINDQFAEEAFTVYDHPKVLIFHKRADYDPARVRELLGAVDLSNVIHVAPREVPMRSLTLMLTGPQLALQQAGGTWSALFDVHGLLNRIPALSVLAWYLTVSLLGLACYPMVRLAFPGLPDRGYPLARTVGLLAAAWLPWMAGSNGAPFTRTAISAGLVLIVAINTGLAYRQRAELAREWRERKRYFLIVEAIALGFFAVDLLIRLGNPDLWHPNFGGEKPMDFSYFNAVLKSSLFPPYDPWFAGGYINYYYYGYVIVGVLVKWLGIVPAVAYNLILPTLYSLVVLGAFSVAWNLAAALRGFERAAAGEEKPFVRHLGHWALDPLLVGLAAAVLMVALGNEGTVRMIWNGWQKLAAPGGNIDQGSFFNSLAWAAQGFVRWVGGARLPYGTGEWYWIPSRAITQGNAITEFPLFTFLYADLHAHMIALPVTLAALAWAVSAVLAKGRWGGATGAVTGFALGGLIIGALRPTNTWDLPTYLALAIAALLYAGWRYGSGEVSIGGHTFRFDRLVLPLIAAAVLVGLSLLLYAPFARWYGQAYNSLDLWKGDRTPIGSYLTHWGLFLFVILSWMAWETRNWMAETPVSALARLRPYQGLIWAGLVLVAGMVAILALQGVQIAILALPAALWAGVLLLRPGQSDAKRVVLFLVGTALALTLAVEVIVLRGDIARMNTVFKFYLQAWTLLAVSAAAALGWLLVDLHAWRPGWRTVWQGGLAALALGAALFTLTATSAKIRDRMAAAAPHTLDGMAYMDYATYSTMDQQMELSQDARAIRWMQENVQGSPVIVEANTPEYQWGTRFTIYTGLPGVVGWNWHQRQQRALLPSSLVTDRVAEVGAFYTTTDAAEAQAFLQRYGVRYVIVGQLERIDYPGAGLEKFAQQDGVLWKLVYDQGETQIYEVIAGAEQAQAGGQP